MVSIFILIATTAATEECELGISKPMLPVIKPGYDGDWFLYSVEGKEGETEEECFRQCCEDEGKYLSYYIYHPRPEYRARHA